MNRREFTLLTGGVISNLMMGGKTLCFSDKQQDDLLEARKLWDSHSPISSEQYIKEHKLFTAQAFNKLNKIQLKNSQIIEFDGVYLSYSELALLASLAIFK